MAGGAPAKSLSAPLSAEYRLMSQFINESNTRPDEPPMMEKLKDGSKWRESDLNKIGIFYAESPITPDNIFFKVQEHLALSGKNSNFISMFSQHVKMLQRTLNEIFTLDLDSFRLLEVRSLVEAYRRQDNAGVSDLRDGSLHDSSMKKEGEAEPWEGNSACTTESRIKDTRIAGRLILQEIQNAQTDASRCQVEYEHMMKQNVMIERLDDFLDSLRNVVMNTLCLEPELNENAFVDLFKDFTNILCVKFKSCGVKRYLKCGQLSVTSRNDLRYDLYENKPAGIKRTVAVAQVKQTVTKTNTDCSPPKKKLRSTSGIPPITCDPEERGDGCLDPLEFPACLRGQHSIELLANLENSFLEPNQTKSMILGMTVEATFVRLTCLDVQHKEFKKIQEQELPNAVKRVGTIYYTKAYDFLKRDDRNDLVLIMRYLLFLSKNPLVKWLPSRE